MLNLRQECPTWWRMYVYLSDEGRAQVMSFREANQNKKLGEGGEGYVGTDEWCYNCAACGHWGDVRSHLLAFMISHLLLSIAGLPREQTIQPS